MSNIKSAQYIDCTLCIIGSSTPVRVHPERVVLPTTIANRLATMDVISVPNAHMSKMRQKY